MIILGVSAFYHEAACCLLKDGKWVAMAAEERFTRLKHDHRLPTHAFEYCLEKAGIHPGEIDCIAYYELPKQKLARQLFQAKSLLGQGDLSWLDAGQPLKAIRNHWGYDGNIRTYPHHMSHAASSFLLSGFEEAAVLVVDGVGEWATTSYGYGQHQTVVLDESVDFPHSIGLWYAAITAYLGFRVNNGEYKVMGLAPYGKPRYLKEMQQLLQTTPGPGFRLDMTYFDYVHGKRMFSQALVNLLGHPARKSSEPIEMFHKDVARSLQVHLEQVLLEKARYLHTKTGSESLCMAGGVALNCVANGKILRQLPFKRLFVQPAAGDDGGCIGAAALAHRDLNGGQAKVEPQTHVFFGPSWSNQHLKKILDDLHGDFEDYQGREEALAHRVAKALAEHKVVGLFHGAMEFGPRALGSRSILANPMDPTIRQKLNQLVKKREGFRPFAPSVLQAQASRHFDLDHSSPYMLETCQVRSNIDLPGITHVDGSARPQTVSKATSPRFHSIIQAFYEQTACPMVVNTSFNLRGEPIVCSPHHALRCAVLANLDFLVLGDFLLDLKQQPKLWETWASFDPQAKQLFRDVSGDALVQNLYSFV